MFGYPARQVRQLVAAETVIASKPDRFEPKLGVVVVLLDMYVRRLAPVRTEEKNDGHVRATPLACRHYTEDPEGGDAVRQAFWLVDPLLNGSRGAPHGACCYAGYFAPVSALSRASISAMRFSSRLTWALSSGRR